MGKSPRPMNAAGYRVEGEESGIRPSMRRTILARGSSEENRDGLARRDYRLADPSIDLRPYIVRQITPQGEVRFTCPRARRRDRQHRRLGRQRVLEEIEAAQPRRPLLSSSRDP